MPRRCPYRQRSHRCIAAHACRCLCPWEAAYLTMRSHLRLPSRNQWGWTLRRRWRRRRHWRRRSPPRRRSWQQRKPGPLSPRRGPGPLPLPPKPKPVYLSSPSSLCRTSHWWPCRTSHWWPCRTSHWWPCRMAARRGHLRPPACPSCSGWTLRPSAPWPRARAPSASASARATCSSRSAALRATRSSRSCTMRDSRRVMRSASGQAGSRRQGARTASVCPTRSPSTRTSCWRARSCCCVCSTGWTSSSRRCTKPYSRRRRGGSSASR